MVSGRTKILPKKPCCKLCGGPNRKDSKLRIDYEAVEFLDDAHGGQMH